jgi:putative restriction endonuclease
VFLGRGVRRRPATGLEPIVGYVRTAHDIIAMLPDDVHAEVIEGEVIVNSATPAGRHAKIILAVRRAFARQGIDNLFENTTLLVEQDEAEYVPDLARWPEHVIDGDTWEFPAAECAFALEVVSGDRPGRRQRDYQKASGYARGAVPVFLLIDPVEGACTLFTEPKGDEYSVRQIVKFGEPLLIPAGDGMVELPTESL